MLMPVIEESGFTLWDVEYVKEGAEYYLRAYIDKEGGITIDDCVDVSRKLSDLLDADDLIEDAYTLEVSSPGLGRKLVKDREFSLSLGRDVDIRFYKPYEGSKDISGQLTGFDKDTVTIRLADSGEDMTYERSLIASVRLSVDI